MYALLFAFATVSPATAQVSVDLGAVDVAITYNGQPVGSLGGGCNFRTELSGASGSYGLNLCDQGHYANIPVGSYTLRLYHWGVYDTPLVSPIPIVVTVGATEPASFEVSGVVGFVTGTVTINSAPANTGGVCVSVGGGENCVGFGPGGTFKAIALAGAGTARVWGNGCQCITLGTMPVTAVAGQTQDGGSLNISLGNAHVEITYNGAPVSSLNAGCNFRTELVSSTGSMGLNLCDQGTYSTIPAGNYTLRLYQMGVYDQPLVPPVAVTVVEGNTANASFEVSGVMGLTTGTVVINGQPPTGGGVCATVSGGQNCVGTNANGEFTVLTMAGAGTGFVWGNGCQCIVLGTFPIVVTAGASGSAGTISLGNGNAHVSITYLGQSINSLNAGCNFRTELTSVTSSFGLNLCGEGDYTGVPAGNYTLKLYHWGAYDQTLVPPVPVTITPGGNVSASFEVGAVMGIVTGFITINGQPATDGGVCGSVMGGQNCVGYGPGGTFRMLLRAGNGSGIVWNNGCQCHVIATFTFGVVAGAITDIGNPLAPAPCAAGSYRATPSDPVCTPAPPGSFVDTVGAVASTLCPVGTYQPAAGSISCLPAQPGSFVDTVGAVASTMCAVGFYQPAAGSISCVPAPPGSFVNTAGMMTSMLCATGTYQPLAGAISCISAPPGSFVSTVGATASALCPAGSYQSLAGAATCLASPAGSFVNTVGATAPTPCPAGTTSGVGATFCTSSDTTPPTVTYVGNAGAYTVNQTISIQCVAADAGSGVASSTCADISGPAWSFPLGANTFSATATDVAGNVSAPVSTTFTVSVSAASLQALVSAFSTNAGVANGLNAKLTAAANANNANARAGQLNAFANQVNAQIGKALTAQQAALLIQLSQMLL